MNGGLHKWRYWAGSQGARALLLVSVLLLNAILPSIGSAAHNTTTPHEMASDLVDHAHMDHAGMGHAASAPSQGSQLDHENHDASLHCMSSACCYQEASVPFALVASDAYLANGLVMDRRNHLPSFMRSTKDRPPQQI
jgi:uncharacterized protein involved in copper resistance